MSISESWQAGTGCLSSLRSYNWKRRRTSLPVAKLPHETRKPPTDDGNQLESLSKLDAVLPRQWFPYAMRGWLCNNIYI